ncbi:MAG: DUF6502 family protein [Burkholderiales bacterium]|jgi:hypothetical protein|nr:DUF6502 family protein [Burkholderiales bacterium]
MSSDPNPVNQGQTTLLGTLRYMLKPLVRLLLRHAVTYPMLLEELKKSYVQVAEAEFEIAGKPQTDSRLSLLTGIHRKDVRRIREEADTNTGASPKANLGAQVVSQWLGNPRYQTDAGTPVALPRVAFQPGDLSFEGLVASISKDLRGKPLLDEWLHAGIVRITEEGSIALNVQAFVPSHHFEQTCSFMGMNIHDHLSAAVHNLQADREPGESFFERCAFDDGLTQAQVQALHDFVRRNGMDFLRSVNQQNINTPKDTAAEGLRFRVNTGVYFYSEPVEGARHDQ